MLFKGVKVLDLSTLLPGPMCSLFLADLGAEVIKVESLKGDSMRRFEAGKITPYFSALNRNKKSIALNLKTKAGKKIFLELAKNADIIIEGFRPGKVDALGIGYENVKKINPRIVYCSITGYGQKGSFRNKAGHDINYSSLSGLLDVLSTKHFVPGVQIADVSCALIAAFSIVASLFNREKNGNGNYIDVSVFNSALSIISIHIAQHSARMKSNVLSGNTPCYNVYETKEGKYVSLGAVENKFWQSFCLAVGRKDLLVKQFDTSIFEDMKKLFKSKTLKELIDMNNKYDFCCEPVKKIEDVIKDTPNKKNLVEIDGIKQVAIPVIFSTFGRLTYSRSPKLGEHTEEILLGAGYNKKVMNKLRKKAVIL